MFSLLGYLFILIFIILIFGLSIISRILRTLFGFGRRTRSTFNSSSNDDSGSRSYTHHNSSTSNDDDRSNAPKRKKIFEENEGEYVEFEEIKDDE